MDKISFLTKAIAEKYTDISVEGAGAIKGKNCQIQSIEPITGGNRVTFAWYDGSDILVSDTLDVMDGADGQDGADGAKGDKGDTGAKGDPGEKGDTGNGIVSITKTGTQGLVDTYTILYTNGNTDTFTVTNGEDGSGAGDMKKSVYDADDTVANAGGIKAYVLENKPNVEDEILIL